MLDALVADAGEWRGSNRLHDPHTGGPQDSDGTATITPVLNGKFVRFDYTWSYDGKPQEGSILFGGEANSNAVSAYWIDSWHMGRGVLPCTGKIHGKESLSVRGTYAAPPGPDWGWRIELKFDGDRTLRMVMVNISPEGVEAPAVEASYVRAS